MRVWTYPEKKYEELGAVRWEVSWWELKPGVTIEEGRDFDYDRDIAEHFRAFKTQGAARRYAATVVTDGRTFFGCASVQKQVVEWYVEEDRMASWENAGQVEEVS